MKLDPWAILHIAKQGIAVLVLYIISNLLTKLIWGATLGQHFGQHDLTYVAGFAVLSFSIQYFLLYISGIQIPKYISISIWLADLLLQQPAINLKFAKRLTA